MIYHAREVWDREAHRGVGVGATLQLSGTKDIGKNGRGWRTSKRLGNIEGAMQINSHHWVTGEFFGAGPGVPQSFRGLCPMNDKGAQICAVPQHEPS